MSDKTKEKKSWLLDLFRTEKAKLLALEKYEVKEGDAIETDADGQVQGDVQDGEYELTDGSTLVVKDGVATKKAAEAPEAEKAADAPEDEAKPADEAGEPTLGDVVARLDSLTEAIHALVHGLGTQMQAEKEKTTTELAAAHATIAKLEEKPAVRKPGVGLGLSAADDKPLTRAQQAVALAKLAQSKC